MSFRASRLLHRVCEGTRPCRQICEGASFSVSLENLGNELVPQGLPDSGRSKSSPWCVASIEFFSIDLRVSASPLHQRTCHICGRYKQGRLGGPWRHVQQTSGNLGNVLCFIDGTALLTHVFVDKCCGVCSFCLSIQTFTRSAFCFLLWSRWQA